ncbi:MAG TPA: hypothetical protein VJ717_11165 [Gemmatimonadaceae bacterium]|nr:hypothetical protein [Gemmatimonadaceae bacterium]
MPARSGKARSRIPRLVRLTVLCAGLLALAGDVAAQGWDAPPATDLVRRAIARRNVQIAESALAGYQSRAIGRLLFLAQLGDTSLIKPRVVKADQIAVDVYWKAPGFSKQMIVGMRDTLLLPGDIGYYQDRYGIVQSNFPNLIRLGEGRDVRDVPHPLAPNAQTIYEYALRDSLAITLPDRRIDVYEIAVRPRDPRAPRVVGSLYLDQTNADVVRMSLTFTDAAILDRRIERLSVVLENALIEGKFWLPRRQELEVARAGTWLDLPVRGIIRGSWQICCYQINVRLDSAVFVGAPIVRAPLSRRQGFTWDEPIADVLPTDIATVTQEDVARVQTIAQGLVSRAALARAKSSAVSARSLGDFVRFNRVEGLALGIGGRSQRDRWTLAWRARYGRDDYKLKAAGRLGVTFGATTFSAFAEDDYVDAGDISEGSSLKNSLAAQEFASDYTQPYKVSSVGGALAFTLGARWTAALSYARHEPAEVNATAARRSFAATIPALAREGLQLDLTADRGVSVGGGDLQLRTTFKGADLELPRTDAESRFARATVLLRYTRERGDHVLRLAAFGGALGVAGNDSIPAQALVYLGGPVSGPGYGYHAFRARQAAFLHAEYGVRIPFPSVPLARYGRSPANARLLPYAHAIGVRMPINDVTAGIYPSLGVALEFFFDLVRVETARGLRDGRWTFSIDISEAFRAVF